MALSDAEKQEEIGFPSRYFRHVRGIFIEYYPDGSIRANDRFSPDPDAGSTNRERLGNRYHRNDDAFWGMLAATIRWLRHQAPLTEYVGLRKFCHCESSAAPFSLNRLSQHLIEEIELLTAIKGFAHLRGLDLGVVRMLMSMSRRADIEEFDNGIALVPDVDNLTAQRILKLPVIKAEIEFRLELVLGLMAESTNYSFNLVPRVDPNNWSVDRWRIQTPVFILARRPEDWTWKAVII